MHKIKTVDEDMIIVQFNQSKDPCLNSLEIKIIKECFKIKCNNISKFRHMQPHFVKYLPYLLKDRKNILDQESTWMSQ